MTAKQQNRNIQIGHEKALQKAMALEIAKNYCEKNGLSFEKLKKQRFECFSGIAVFANPSTVAPDGLRNDLDTQPIPTLFIKYINDELKIQETEYTKKFLS